ncbi:uncharacterized protein LOC106661851 isoform X2 [Cimex lectularius]|uniref:Beta-sarcoglycan n=1 Tax=Cimex lectularius TaxID=79782 RepID=A0A8I6R9G7_CIMLE|nr:uncharacterized protein LOC106661851 isoform X2 [Cimex lectularius]
MMAGKDGAVSCRRTATKQSTARYENSDDSFVKPTNTKIYAFWTLVGLLCLLALANMILTIVIFSVLRLGQGMESMELLPDEGLVKFFGDSNFGKVSKSDGNIEGFAGSETEIKGVKGPVILEVEDAKGRQRNTLTLEQNGTQFKSINSFKVGDVFSTDNPVFKLSKSSVIRNVQSRVITTNKITAPQDEKLVLRSDTLIKIKGSEGTKIDGKEIIWTADQEVKLKSMNGSIVLSGKSGVVVDLKKIPIVGTTGLGGPITPQYKVCVCMPQGKLFKVPVSTDYNSQVACHNIDTSTNYNPCM